MILISRNRIHLITHRFVEVYEKRGNCPVAAQRAYLIYWHDPGKPFPVVDDAEAKVSFKFVFDYKIKVLVEVNNLFYQPS